MQAFSEKTLENKALLSLFLVYEWSSKRGILLIQGAVSGALRSGFSETFGLRL